MKKKITSLQNIRKSFVLQHDQSDCGVACLLSLINLYGGRSSFERIREITGTTKLGTTLLGLYQGANQLGFDAEGCEANIDALIDHGKPTILHVLIDGRLQHYIVCFRFDTRKKKFIIGDPGKGITKYSIEELESIWNSKTCITLNPNHLFKKAESAQRQKAGWFLTLLKQDYRLLMFSIGLGVVVAILGMAMAVFSQKLIDEILPSKNYTKLVTGIILVSFLLLTRVALSVIREYFLIKQTKHFNNRIIDSFFGALLNLPKPFFDTRRIGELVARLNDTQRVQKVIRLIAGNIIIDAFTVIVSFGFLFYYSWQTGMISMVCLPLYYFLLFRFNSKIINIQKEVMQGYALSESNFISSIQGIATVKNNNKQSIFQKINQLIYGDFQNRAYDLGKLNIKLSLISALFSVIFLIVVLAYNGMRVYNEKLQLGELMAILSIVGSLLPSIANLALITIPVNEAKVAFNRMFEVVSMPEEDKGEEKLEFFKSLEIRNLYFRFAGGSRLLENVNLQVRIGECIALIGESGSGKSTLGQILQKFYIFESGEIVVNSTQLLQHVKTSDWRNLIGVVPQEITIFSGTILDNIMLGEQNGHEDVIKFCREFNFEKYIAQLPQGYATIVGEDGLNLSGGQKQIIGLIRALYKRPHLLILDEPTSAMDRKTERFVIDLINGLKRNAAILIISHRIQSLKCMADRIYVLENGSILLNGNHFELM